jgi:hypothetical protein
MLQHLRNGGQPLLHVEGKHEQERPAHQKQVHQAPGVQICLHAWRLMHLFLMCLPLLFMLTSRGTVMWQPSSGKGNIAA